MPFHLILNGHVYGLIFNQAAMQFIIVKLADPVSCTLWKCYWLIDFIVMFLKFSSLNWRNNRLTRHSRSGKHGRFGHVIEQEKTAWVHWRVPVLFTKEAKMTRVCMSEHSNFWLNIQSTTSTLLCQEHTKWASWWIVFILFLRGPMFTVTKSRYSVRIEKWRVGTELFHIHRIARCYEN